jgi:hypothetical protein
LTTGTHIRFVNLGGGLAHAALDPAQDVVPLGRLRENHVRSGLTRPGLCSDVLTGHRRDAQGSTRFGAKRANENVAGDVRQIEITDQDIDVMLPRQVDRIPTVTCSQYLEAVGLQQ